MPKSKLILLLLTLLIACENANIEFANQKFELSEQTIAQLQEAYDNSELSVESVVKDYLDRIEKLNKQGPNLNAVIAVNPDAIEIAKKLDAELQEGNKRSPLHGIPILIKDNIDTRDSMPTTAGSRALINNYVGKDAFIIDKLRKSGAVILGKANLSEWANFRGDLSSSGWSGIGGQTKNPYDVTRNPCGSSSGSGVSVSANLCMLAIGTETNGSIVCPSTANGIVGIKPTVGLLSRSGIIPISFTQDTPGPMARTVTDAAICLTFMTGIDPNDSKTQSSFGHISEDYSAALKRGALKGSRLGIYKSPLGRHYKVDSLFYQAVDDFKNAGAEVVELENLSSENPGSYSFQVMLYEFKDGLNKYLRKHADRNQIRNLDDLIAFNLKDSIELKYYDQELIKMANEKGSLEDDNYKSALANMLRLRQQEGIDKVMEDLSLDAIIAPTGSPAWKTDLVNGDAYHLGSSSPAAQAGYPNITVPMGNVDGLPVGISIFGSAWSEEKLIALAYDYEQITKHRISPDL